MKKMGQHIHVNVVSLRRYEDFAIDVSNRLSQVLNDVPVND